MRTNDEHVTLVLYIAYYVAVCLVVLHGCQFASAHLLKCIWCTPIEKHLPTPLQGITQSIHVAAVLPLMGHFLLTEVFEALCLLQES